MYDSVQKLSKLDVEVMVHLDDGSEILGIMSVSQGQRISDLMNDERSFLPLQTTGGSVVILRKTAIARVAQLDQQIDLEKISDPYEILGASPNISDEELQSLYRTLCAENHPDKVQSSGLSAQFVEMANSRMIRINDAYQRIMASRKSEGADEDEVIIAGSGA